MGLKTDGWKQDLDDYVNSAKNLFESMLNNGFAKFYALPVDPGMELLDGSHRLACALALWLEKVPVELMSRRVWAPAWDYDWFTAKEMPDEDFDQLMKDWEFLCG